MESPRYRPIDTPNLRHSTNPEKKMFCVNIWVSDYVELEELAKISNLSMSAAARHAFNCLIDSQKI